MADMDLAGKRIVVTGGAGFLGRFVCEKLRARGCTDVLVPRQADYDLTTEPAVERMYADMRPDVVLHLAAEVGGIGANMIESFRLAYVMQRSVDVTAGPDPAWSWLENGWNIMPAARSDEVTWSYDPMDPWHIAFTPGIRPLEVKVDGEVVFADGKPTRVDADEVRAKAAEQAARLHARL